MDLIFFALEAESQVQNKQRIRSNSAEGWTTKDESQSGKRTTFGGSMDRAKGEEKQRHKAVRQDSYLAAVKPLSSNTGTRHGFFFFAVRNFSSLEIIQYSLPAFRFVKISY